MKLVTHSVTCAGVRARLATGVLDPVVTVLCGYKLGKRVGMTADDTCDGRDGAGE